jgi:hypothetical protein
MFRTSEKDISRKSAKIAREAPRSKSTFFGSMLGLFSTFNRVSSSAGPMTANAQDAPDRRRKLGP